MTLTNARGWRNGRMLVKGCKLQVKSKSQGSMNVHSITVNNTVLYMENC